MGAEPLGPWRPLSLDETVRLFAHHPFRWWITGGRALELHVGRSWRDHDDSDVSVLRDQVFTVRSTLAEWDLHIAAAGVLTAWNGKALYAEKEQNNLWCRRQANDPWSLDVTISDGDHESWVYRRDPTIRVPWRKSVLRSAEGIPYLAPELQLLFKSKDLRRKDSLDAQEVIPQLDAERQSRLREALPDDHDWQSLLAG